MVKSWLLHDPIVLAEWHPGGWYNKAEAVIKIRSADHISGKTILASVVVDAVREISDATFAFFYCKHSDPTRNSFIGVARAVLAQILDQDPHLLSYFHEMASTTDSTMLSSVVLAKRMLEMSFNSCGKLYIIIDGLDECERGERKEISTWLQHIIQELPAAQINSLRCLIISQDDGNARKDLKDFAAIKMTDENHGDLRQFTAEWQKRIEHRFGELRPENRQLANTIFARAQGMSAMSWTGSEAKYALKFTGMFIFAELLGKYLKNLPIREDLYKELDPAKFPVKLDHVYVICPISPFWQISMIRPQST